MQFKWALLGLLVVFVALGGVTPVPIWGQTSSTFPFTLQGGSLPLCWFYGVSFSATQGQQITFQWAENLSSAGPVSMDFYIVPASSFHLRWYCQQGPEYVYWTDGAYGTANWAAPFSSGYSALLVNYGYYPISGTISITAPNGTVSAIPLGPSTVPRQLCYGQNC
jgi:hypothetical protein